MNIKWDADKYTKDFSFVHQYGNSVIELLDLDSTMTVLDLGCGNGALTKKLTEMGVKAIGLDASQDLLQIAKTQYNNIEFVLSDATSFALKEPVDAVFSNAVFHWIDREKQSDMMHCVYSSLKAGGQFVFEFGGVGNCNLIHSALKMFFEQHGFDYVVPNYFPTIGEYAALLEQSNFKVVSMLLFDRMTELKGQDGMADWIRMFVKKPFEGMNENVKNHIIEQTTEYLKDKLYKDGVWYADYVRIRGKAIKK